MSIVCFKATLTRDAIFSERSSTLGSHTTLPYIPGSVLLGCCAGKLYAGLGTDAFTVFHSGSVRFGNAYPLDAVGNRTYPVPLSWHTEKNSQVAEDGRIIPENIWNLLHHNDEIEKQLLAENAQPKQVREGFFSLQGSFVDPLSNYRLKTAIDRNKAGRSQEAQLFGYESLNAGSQWYFGVHFNDNLTPRIKDDICRVLTGTRLRIGKSRLSEYGGNLRVVIDDDTAPVFIPQICGHYLFFYCLSDAAFRDDVSGIPVHLPTANQIGLTGTILEREKCFVRTRKYAPFNTYRKCWDMERQVLCRGSIITFKADTQLTQGYLNEVQKTLNKGVGLFRQDGLGSFLVNPGFLVEVGFNPAAVLKTAAMATEINSTSAVKQADSQCAGLSTESSRLVEWLTLKYNESRIESSVSAAVDGWITELVPALRKARNKAPGKAQWAQLRDIAVLSENMAGVHDAFVNDKYGLCNHGISKEKWQGRFYSNSLGRMLSYKDFMSEVVLKSREGMDEKDLLSFTRQVLFRLAKPSLPGSSARRKQ